MPTPSRPEPLGFGAEIDRIALEIVSTTPRDETWLDVRLRIRNGTGHAFTPRLLALWSRNVGWYGWKDGMADDGVRFDPASVDREIEPGASAELDLAILRQCARQGSRSPARRVRIDFSYLDENGRGHEISSNEIDFRARPGGPSIDARPIGPGPGCLGALFGRRG